MEEEDTVTRMEGTVIHLAITKVVVAILITVVVAIAVIRTHLGGGGGMGPQNLGDKMPWIMGGDIIYRVPTVKGLGIGVRYQYMFTPKHRNAAFLNLNPKFNAHRIGFSSQFPSCIR